MDWSLVEGNWEHFQGRIKGRWSKLTGERLTSIGGQRAQLVRKVEELYSVSAETAELQVQEFELRNRDYRPSTSSCSKWRAVV